MELERELETYTQKLPELLADEGKFVLIRGNDVAGIYTSYEDAIGAGYEKFGLTPFMVKQIHAVEQILHFTRAIKPCHT